MRHQVTETLGPWINEAIDKHGQGEKILWEPGLMPTRDGLTIVVCVFWMPGAVLGTSIQGSIPVQDPLHATEDGVEAEVADFLHRMREARSQQVEENPEPSGPPHSNGHRTSTSGLILP